jgi:hypothetical protein
VYITTGIVYMQTWNSYVPTNTVQQKAEDTYIKQIYLFAAFSTCPSELTFPFHTLLKKNKTKQNKTNKTSDMPVLLFNLTLEKVVRDSEIETKGTAYNKSTQILAYAHDIVIVGRSTDALRETLKKLMKAAQVMGLTVNMQKTKYMEVTKRPTNTKMIIGNQQYERVKEFKYLGTTLTADNDISTEIKQRIITANKTSCGLKKQLNSPYLKWQTECVLYKTLIRPTLIYGSESWPLSKKEESLVQIYERRFLRRIYGPINEGGI